jgi:hypothetical protein
MRTKWFSGTGLAGLLALGMTTGAVVAAHAEETEYKLTACGHLTTVMLQSSPDLTVQSEQVWYIIAPPATPKVFENNTGQCVGYARMMNGKRTAMGSCRWTDPDGDTFIGESVDIPDKPGVWTFLSGTGKWKGIRGNGTYQLLGISKPRADGTAELCVLLIGKYALQ